MEFLNLNCNIIANQPKIAVIRKIIMRIFEAYVGYIMNMINLNINTIEYIYTPLMTCTWVYFSLWA